MYYGLVIKVKNYKRAFTLAYAVNRFINPYLVKYFSKKNVKVDEDMYALSEMIQLIFRSGIRNNEDINIYIPSSRIRKLLIDFLEVGYQTDKNFKKSQRF